MRFGQKPLMIKHIQEKHPPTNKCKLCMIAFFTQNDLNNHEKLVHQKDVENLTQKSGMVQNKGNHSEKEESKISEDKGKFLKILSLPKNALFCEFP